MSKVTWNLARHLPAPLSALSLLVSGTHVLSSAPRLRRSAPIAPPAQARIIVNPTSGGGRGASAMRELAATASWLTEHGLVAELCPTTAPGGARILAAEAVSAGMRMVIAAGGDGTINEVVQELAGHTAALGVLPIGTVNVWAREMNIPLSLTEARKVLIEGLHRRIDLGRAGSRYFLMFAGIGIDAEAARRVEHRWLKRVGLKLLDYVALGGFLGLTQRPARVWVRVEGRRRATHAVQIVVGNTRLWGGTFAFTPNAFVDDGWLDVVFVGGHHVIHRVAVILRALLRLPTRGSGVRYERVRTLCLESETPLGVEVDGELHGYLPMTFSIMPNALTVVLPHNAPADLFIRQPITSTS
jgi:YegS/Rv2252/BmrU family lipid kinase